MNETLAAGRMEVSLAEAIALSAHGIAALPDSYLVEASGHSWHTWSVVGEQMAEARRLISGARAAAGDYDALPADHSFRAALAAYSSFCCVVSNMESGAPLPVLSRTGGALCHLRPDGIPFTHGSEIPHTAVVNHAVAAGFCVCGFQPLGWKVLPNSGPACVFERYSRTMPGLSADELLRAVQESVVVLGADGLPSLNFEDVVIGAYPSGEHPFCYAVQALENAGILRESARQCLRNAHVIMRGRGPRAGRSAMVSASLLEEGIRSDVRDELPAHLGTLRYF